jgi:Na+-translocating ferredoxin:NAD+ oxidoreductase RnfC subunit
MCPRHLLGHPIEPHKNMRALGFTPQKDHLIAGSLYCCECNICSLIACPEDLDPKDACVHDKPAARQQGLGWTGKPEEIRPHPLFRERRVPIRRLMAKLGLMSFRNVGPLTDVPLRPGRVVLPLRQHVGSPALPVVRLGQRVRTGDLVAAPPEGKLGANIHASIDGRVQSIEDTIVIEA